MLLNSLNLPFDSKTTIVEWNDYLTLAALLKYFTATKKQYIDLWMGYLNPKGMPKLHLKEIYHPLELLVRGTFTEGSTLVSERFAQGFCRILYDKNCLLAEDPFGRKFDKKKMNPDQTF